MAPSELVGAGSSIRRPKQDCYAELNKNPSADAFEEKWEREPMPPGVAEQV
jgi:hypothetical protein